MRDNGTAAPAAAAKQYVSPSSEGLIERQVMATGKLLDEEQAAAFLSERTSKRISQRTLKQWRLDGRISYLRIGQSPRYREADLEAFIEAGHVPAKAPA